MSRSQYLTTNIIFEAAAKHGTVARLKAERTSVASGRDSPADLPNCGLLGQSDHAANERDVATLPNGPTNGSLIAVSDVDRIFNRSKIKKLADTLKLPALGDDPQFAESVRNDIRLFIEAKGRLNNAGLKESITKLYRLTARAEGDDLAADSLARAIDAMPSDVWDWLAHCNPEARVPTRAEIVSPETRASAVQQLRHILSYGESKKRDRKRPTGKHSQSCKPKLRVPETEPNRPRSDAERELVRNLGLTYLNATGKPPPRKVNFQSRSSRFSQFVHECFELVGAPSGSVTRLINELGQARRAAANHKVERRGRRLSPGTGRMVSAGSGVKSRRAKARRK